MRKFGTRFAERMARPTGALELMADLARSPAVQARGLALEVHGRWAPELQGLRHELQSLGVQVDDRYLDADALRALEHL